MVQQTSRRTKGFVIFLVALAGLMLLGGWLWHAWDHQANAPDARKVVDPALSALEEAQGRADSVPEAAPIPTVVIPDGPAEPAAVQAPVIPEDPVVSDDAAAVARKKSSDLNRMGYRAYKRGDIMRARRMYRLATDEDPSYALAWYNLACMEGLRGDKVQALEALRRSKAADPSQDLASRVRGDEDFEALWRDAGWMTQVASLDRQAPDPSLLRSNKPATPAYQVGDVVSNPLRSSAEMALIQQRVSEARDLYRKATHANIQDADAWMGLARSEAMLGGIDPTLEALQEYRALRPRRDLIMEVSEDDAFARVWEMPGFQAALRRLAQ